MYFFSNTSLQDLLITIDNTVQYGEDADVRTRDFEYPDKEEREDE